MKHPGVSTDPLGNDDGLLKHDDASSFTAMERDTWDRSQIIYKNTYFYH